MHNNVSLKSIVDKLGGEVSKNAEIKVFRVGSLALAEEGAISFFNDTKYSRQLRETKASAVILKPEHATLTTLPAIITDNPYAYFAKVSQLLNPGKVAKNGIHPTAIIDPSVTIPTSCSIGAYAIVEGGVVLGNSVVIGAASIVERDTVLGDETVLESNVTIKHGCQIGKNCHFFSGAVIGNDGFGYAEEKDTEGEGYWVKIPQIGRVVIRDNVDIGANTTVDRGAIDDTLIDEGVKIDNLVQIAHNCRIGAHTVIAGCVGIAGSAVIGKHCKLGGAAMVLGHLSIADGVTISPGSMIMRSILKEGTYTALMPFQPHDTWLKTAANIRHLSQLTDRIKVLESALESIETLRKP
jgi:UDP-3-O-[3-hydroxymyristoyl] glucosamine N-acyltransferase